jgi:hypothetical protein
MLSDEKSINKALLTTYCTEYNINYNEFSDNDRHKFRYVCFKYNQFMKHVPLPNIQVGSIYEAVFVDFRILPNIEFVVRTAIIKLGSAWSFTIVCGNKNVHYVKQMVKRISTNIKVIKLDYDNMTRNEYSNFLMTSHFWNLLHGDKILIYQEDSLIFKKNIMDFIQYDYIGAPFPKGADDTPNCVGNGGLSLRTKSKMIEVIKKYPVKNFKIGNSTKKYMASVGMDTVPEDVYFSKNIQDYKIGNVADWDTAYQFSSESTFNPNSFGCHQLWSCTTKWQNHLKKVFEYDIYVPNSNITDYLLFSNLSKDIAQIKHIPNAFDIDLDFFCKVNKFEYINKTAALTIVQQKCMQGYIYHPKQLLNYFPDLIFITFLKEIYILHENTILPLPDFAQKYIYDAYFDSLCNLSISKKFDTLNNKYDIIILVFIGNEELGIDLLNYIIKYKKIQSEFNVAFCFNNKIPSIDKIKQIIKDNFEFYAIYKCNEFGTDIIPTMLMYNDIIKSHHFQHIIKLHTKRIKAHYVKLTRHLLSTPLKTLITKKHKDCNCIGFPDNYISLSADVYNSTILSRYKSQMNKSTFVAGTIFYTTGLVFDSVLKFIKTNNYKEYLLNNLYENNTINKDYSPIHFLERVFGIIQT